MEQRDELHGSLTVARQAESLRGPRMNGVSEPHMAGAPVKLSVAMPAFNEERTIGEAIEGILKLDVPFDIELIVVDDGSTDATPSIIESFDDARIVVLTHRRRKGKGACLLDASAVATGTHFLVFDADLEYAAEDIPSLFEPVLKGLAHVVYGARLPGMRTAFYSFRYALGSKATTVLANILFDAWLSDMHTCLKLMPTHLFRDLHLTQTGFGLDTEITAEILRRGVRPFEVPCSYRGRSIENGKKISTRDGFECVKVLAKVRLRGRIAYDPKALEPLRVVPGARLPLRTHRRRATDHLPEPERKEDRAFPPQPHGAQMPVASGNAVSSSVG
jgi:hypothetical protein